MHHYKKYNTAVATAVMVLVLILVNSDCSYDNGANYKLSQA